MERSRVRAQCPARKNSSKRTKRFNKSLKAPGEFWFTIVVAVLVGLVHPLQWQAGAFVLLGTIVSGINGLIKWMAGRTRPFHLWIEHACARLAPFELSPFRGGLPGLFVSKNLCFPSGHAALAFATAEALAMLYPRAPVVILCGCDRCGRRAVFGERALSQRRCWSSGPGYCRGPSDSLDCHAFHAVT